MKSTNYEAHHYAVFSILLLPLSYVHIFSSAPYSYVLPLLDEAKFHAQVKQQLKLCFCMRF